MARNRTWSNNPDAVEVGEVMEAFETINRVVLTVTLRVGVLRGARKLVVEIQAHNPEMEIGEQPSLASVRLYPGSTHPPSVDAAILQGLYTIDFELAQQAWATTSSEA